MNNHLTLRFATIFLFTLLATYAHGQSCPGSPGCLDTTFGIGGQNIVSPPANLAGGSGMQSVVQSDGKIVALINAADPGTSFRNALVRFTPDGQIDATFGTGGFAYVTWSAPNAGLAFSIAIQVAGGEERFVLSGGGGSCTGQTVSCQRVERWTNSGVRDSTFGTNGVVSFKTTSATTVCWPSAIQADQKILVSCDSTLYRFNSNGSVDNTFGKKGVSQANSGIVFKKLLLLAGGKILGGGSASGNAAVGRFNSNGSFDTSFGNGGKTTIDIAGFPDHILDMAVDPAGRIVAVGEAMIGGNHANYDDALILRLNSNGQLDTTFGTGGKVTFDISARQDEFTSVALQSDGKIVVAGEGRAPGTPEDWLVARFNSNGSFDPTFGNSGWFLQEYFGDRDHASTVNLVADPGCGGCAKLVVSGSARTATASFTAVARYSL